MQKLVSDLSQILVYKEQIESRIRTLGKEITEDYLSQDIEEIAIICITNGSLFFTADILRQIDMHVQLDSIRVASYRDDTNHQIAPQILDNIRIDIESQHVLLIDDILDTGRTITRITNALMRLNPASLKSCLLLNKKGRQEVHFQPDYVGFDVPDEFVVGYGLDFAERYRNLDCIGVLRPELQNPPEWQ